MLLIRALGLEGVAPMAVGDHHPCDYIITIINTTIRGIIFELRLLSDKTHTDIICYFSLRF